MTTTSAARIVVLFNLKKGVEFADYERWATSRDLPTVNALPSIEAFEVFASTGLLGGGDPPYAYIEIIDITDSEAFFADIGSADMTALAAEFQAFADPVFITTRKL